MSLARIIAPAAASLALACILAACPSGSSGDAAITAFTIRHADNETAFGSAQTDDAESVIDQELRTIEVWIDAGVTDFTALVPTISISGTADLYPASGEARDFSQTPVTYKLLDASGHATVYYVTFRDRPDPAPADALRITEYFCGTGQGTATTGELNRYLELYNGSAEAVDLSQYRLVQRRSRNGIRAPALDQAVWLAGSVAAGSYHLIYSATTNTSLLSTVAAFGAKRSDSAYNGILDSDGSSGYDLILRGAVVDTVGPDDGTSYASNTCYFRRFDYAAGTPGPASARWDPGAWASAPIGGLLGDDANAGVDSLTGSSLLSVLATEGGTSIPATVSGTTATILLPDGVDAASLMLSFGSFGVSMSLDGVPFAGNTVRADLREERTLTIEGQDGSESTYTVKAIPRYAATGYGFDGNIAGVLAKIWAGNGSDVDLGSTTVTGVVTAKGIYPDAFVIEDANAGLYFYTSAGISFPVGAKVRVIVNTGKLYYGLPEVTEFDGEIQSAASGLFSIHYSEGDYAKKDALCRVYKYDGAIAQGGLAYYKGQFAGDLYFHYPKDIQDYLAKGNSGVFYGPVSYVRENYTMELVTVDQFSLR